MHTPDAVTCDDHEVVVIVERQDFHVRHRGDHLLLWRQGLVPLIEVVAWKRGKSSVEHGSSLIRVSIDASETMPF